MKRKLIIALLMLSLVGNVALAAQAPEQKLVPVMVEGMEEEVLFTCYTSENGYALWYDAERFTLIEEGSDGRVQIVPVGQDETSDVRLAVSWSDATGLTLEDAVQDERDSLSQKGYTVVEMDASSLLDIQDVAGISGIRYEEVVESYLFDTQQGVYTLELTYPIEAAEGFGQRLFATVQMFEILPLGTK